MSVVLRWRVAVALCLAWAVRTGAVPPPPEQMVADCDTPTYATDQLVCADAELKAMDAALRAALAELDAERINAPPPFVESQSDWFKRRSRCAPPTAACSSAAERSVSFDPVPAGVRATRRSTPAGAQPSEGGVAPLEVPENSKEQRSRHGRLTA